MDTDLLQGLNETQVQLLTGFDLSLDDMQWVVEQIVSLQEEFDNPPGSWLTNAYLPHTQRQVGYLAGLMDLEDDDRIKVLELITGLELHWDFTDDFPGAANIENMTNPEKYPGPSSKDLRLTRYITSVLINYYINGEGIELNEKLGLSSKRAAATARSKARRAAKLSEKEQRLTAELGY